MLVSPWSDALRITPLTVSKRDGGLTISAETIILAFGAIAIIGLVTAVWQDHADIVGYQIKLETRDAQITELNRRVDRLEEVRNK